ncbi:MAG: DUF4031 domain-containing protein [Hyphomicrobium sp.]
MTVYVDNMEASFQPSHRPGRTYVMCHMIADTDDELHAMADKIGVARKWFQGDHYDIAKSKRALAIQNGAVALSMRDLSAMAMLKRWGRPMGDPTTARARLNIARKDARAERAETQPERQSKGLSR